MTGWVIPHERYQNIKRLGSGGMAEVWLAEDVVTGEKVVAKRPRPDRLDLCEENWSELIKRFAREAELLKTLHHRGIPRWRCDGGWPVRPWIIMDFVEGQSLETYTVAHGVLPVVAATAIMVDLLDILGKVHPRRVVHRDIKPFNVYIDGEARIHLLDFGIAFDTDPDATRLTKWGSTPGSPGYMSPEAIRGKTTVTPAADVYSCGCLLFKLLTGQPPFLTDHDLNRNHLEVTAPRVSELRSGVPGPIDDIVARMLEKDPRRRPTVTEAEGVMREFLPTPESPPLDKVLNPDPTERYRGIRPKPPTQIRMPRPTRRRPVRPDRARFQEMVREARKEMQTGADARVDELKAVLPAALGAWGRMDSDVAKAQVCCADADLRDGDWVAAGRAYRAVITGHARSSRPEIRETVLDASFGRSECLLAERRDEEGFKLWATTSQELEQIDGRPQRLMARRDEIAAELTELGFAEQVKQVLGQGRARPDGGRF